MAKISVRVSHVRVSYPGIAPSNIVKFAGITSDGLVFVFYRPRKPAGNRLFKAVMGPSLDALRPVRITRVWRFVHRESTVIWTTKGRFHFPSLRTIYPFPAEVDNKPILMLFSALS